MCRWPVGPTDRLPRTDSGSTERLANPWPISIIAFSPTRPKPAPSLAGPGNMPRWVSLSCGADTPFRPIPVVPRPREVPGHVDPMRTTVHARHDRFVDIQKAIAFHAAPPGALSPQARTKILYGHPNPPAPPVSPISTMSDRNRIQAAPRSSDGVVHPWQQGGRTP